MNSAKRPGSARTASNAIREVVVRPGPDLDLDRATAQFERKDRVGSCVAAEFFADTSCFEDISFWVLLEFESFNLRGVRAGHQERKN